MLSTLLMPDCCDKNCETALHLQEERTTNPGSRGRADRRESNTRHASGNCRSTCKTDRFDLRTLSKYKVLRIRVKDVVDKKSASVIYPAIP